MHEHAGKISVSKQILEHIQHLRVEKRRCRELTGGGCARENKDSRSNDGPDAQRCQRPRSQSLLESGFWSLGVGD